MANTFKVQYLMEKVRKGDLLMEVDLQELIKEGYDPTTMVIVTNSSRFKISLLVIRKIIKQEN